MQGKERPHYDVIVVGAGPAGSTLSYFLGKLGRKVLLLEKKKFPRDKYCGDAVCKTAIEILHEMGVYEELIRDNKAHVVSLLYSEQRVFSWTCVLIPGIYPQYICLY